MSDNCRTCHALIDWAISDTTGRRMPVDHQPTDAGNLAVRRDSGGVLRARSAPAGAELRRDERRGMSHFATCPDADDHRKT